jgi:hypothetical protein
MRELLMHSRLIDGIKPRSAGFRRAVACSSFPREDVLARWNQLALRQSAPNAAREKVPLALPPLTRVPARGRARSSATLVEAQGGDLLS